MQTLHVTDPDYENFPHQFSSVEHILSSLGTLKDTISNIRDRFPQNDYTNLIQTDLNMLPMVFRSVLNQFSSHKNPDVSLLIVLSSLLQCQFINVFFPITAITFKA